MACKALEDGNRQGRTTRPPKATPAAAVGSTTNRAGLMRSPVATTAAHAHMLSVTRTWQSALTRLCFARGIRSSSRNIAFDWYNSSVWAAFGLQMMLLQIKNPQGRTCYFGGVFRDKASRTGSILIRTATCCMDSVQRKASCSMVADLLLSALLQRALG